MVRNIPLSRAAQVAPFADFLDRIGAPTERGLERHKLPSALREKPGMLVSTRAVTAFVGDMARREGIDDFGWRVTSPRLDQFSPGLVRAIHRSPTLLRAIETTCALTPRESSKAQAWLEDRGDAVFLCHRGSVEFGTLGADELTEMRAGLALSIVRIFTAPDWVPTACGLAITGEIGPFVREEMRDARIVRTHDYSWLRLPRSILARPPRLMAPEEPKAGARDGDDPAPDLVGSLFQLLRPYFTAGGLSLRDAAHLAGTSVRSLQRELTRAGASYRDILQRVKFDAARELLGQPDVKIIEVAYETGFTDPAHFTRFFRRLAGVTPREYRTSFTKESH